MGAFLVKISFMSLLGCFKEVTTGSGRSLCNNGCYKGKSACAPWKPEAQQERWWPSMHDPNTAEAISTTGFALLGEEEAL